MTDLYNEAYSAPTVLPSDEDYPDIVILDAGSDADLLWLDVDLSDLSEQSQ